MREASGSEREVKAVSGPARSAAFRKAAEAKPHRTGTLLSGISPEHLEAHFALCRRIRFPSAVAEGKLPYFENTFRKVARSSRKRGTIRFSPEREVADLRSGADHAGEGEGVLHGIAVKVVVEIGIDIESAGSETLDGSRPGREFLFAVVGGIETSRAMETKVGEVGGNRLLRVITG
jgi:hypothetical protein